MLKKPAYLPAHFPLKACETCEYREKCHCKKQKKSYVVRISIKSIGSTQQQKKAERNRRENISMRAGIEGTHSALKRGHGLSKLKVRGLIKCSITVGYKVLAQNFKRFAKYMLEQVKKLEPGSQEITALIRSQ